VDHRLGADHQTYFLDFLKIPSNCL
jgi:hypothetical protein